MAVDVSSIIANQYALATSYGSTATTDLQSAITSALSHFGNITAPTISWQPTTTDADKPVTSTQTVTAAYQAPNWIGNFDPNSIQQLSPVQPLQLPTAVTINTTGLFNEALPQNNVPDFTQVTPNIDFTGINAALASIGIPTIHTFDAPTLAPINIGTMPTVTVPTFNYSLAADDPGKISGVEQQYAAQYANMAPQMKAFVDQGVATWQNTYAPGYAAGVAALEAAINDGLVRGTGLGANFEEALFTRARARAEEAHERVILEITNGPKKRGDYEISDGARNSGIAMAHKATSNAIGAVAVEVAIERSKQELEYKVQLLQLSNTLRQNQVGAFIQYAGIVAQVNGQALEYAKTFSDLLISQYELAVKRYLAQMEYFKTAAILYESQLKSALAQLEIYKLSLEANKLQVEVETLQITAYKTQVEAELMRIQMYSELLKNIEVRAEVAKTQIEVYAEQVNAFSAQLNGQKIKTDIYLAALQGDKYKLDSQVTLLDAYKTQVEAQVERVKGDVSIQELRNTNNKLLVEVYGAEVEGFKAQVEGATANFKGTLEGQLGLIEAYKASLEVQIKTYLATIERDKLTLEKADEQAKLNWEAINAYVQATLASWKLQSEITAQVGSTLGSMSSAALVAQGTMVAQTTAA